MRLSLKLHPDSLGSAVTRVEAEALWGGAGNLVLSYFVTGRISELCLPPNAAATRTDGLWQHTCFEAFVRRSPGLGYYEFNFSPSLQWAAYRFSTYRDGMCIATEISAPRIETQSGSKHCALHASLALDHAKLPGDGPLRLGLSAIIEEKSGRKSYWALAHRSGKPDFHHPDCFAGELSPA
jgi:hypothetical protein